MSEVVKKEEVKIDEGHPPAPGLAEKLAKLKAYLQLSRYMQVGRKLGPMEKLFAVALLSVSLVGALSVGYGILVFKKSQSLSAAKPESGLHESADEGDEHDEASEEQEVHGANESEHASEKGSEHGSESKGGEDQEEDLSIITQNAIPKSILDRQDGQISPGQDLVEPQIENTRSLASVLKDELQVEGPPKYVELTELLAGSRGGDSGDSVMIGEIVLVMNNYPGQQEASGKITELKALVSSIVADLTKEELRSFEGKTRLKIQIQREVNHLITKGQVKDVLLTKFLVR